MMGERRYGREVCGDPHVAEAREWLITNGRGGYAMGTIAGTLTRRYHGLLIAALQPPVQRRLVLAKCELTVEYDGITYALAANRWASGAVDPTGYRFLESFALCDGLPRWTYALSDALLEVTLAMPDGIDATALALRVVRARAVLRVRARVLCADRDHHGGPLPDPSAFAVTLRDGGATIALPASQRTLEVTAPDAAVEANAAERDVGFFLAREAERGISALEDYVHPLTLTWTLEPDARTGVVFSIDGEAPRDACAIVDARRAANRARVEAQATPLLGELVLAADAFLVTRGSAVRDGRTIIAGYPWFADWGRDTMIALPGLALATGRADVAREILMTFAGTVDGGMLPNRFPDDGSAPEYNTVDAALWYIEAVRAYVAATNDGSLLDAVWPTLCAIVDGYVSGTRYGIRVDDDGLVRAGVPGVQLTWMDAKVGENVITPRIGKPIEISALWYAGMRAMEAFAARLAQPAARYRELAERCEVGFARFWNAEHGYCFDVLDGPDGDDPALRPNQLFAVALHASALDDAHAKAIVDACACELVTSAGVRTLAPSDPRYIGTYAGDQTARDAAYHQGTVWPWLIGPFVRAHLRVYHDPALARTFLDPVLDMLGSYGIGTLPEIAEGDPPHPPRGCIAQAWSVAEVIITLRELAGYAS